MLASELPEGWSEHEVKPTEDNGFKSSYWYNEETDVSTYVHPTDNMYKLIYRQYVALEESKFETPPVQSAAPRPRDPGRKGKKAESSWFGSWRAAS